MEAGRLYPRLEEQLKSKRPKNHVFYAVEDVLGHLIFVTWNLEEARQLSASMILSGKVQRNLIAIRRVSSAIVHAPSTESGGSVKPAAPTPRTAQITSSNSGTSFTLGYYIEKHFNSSKLDLSTIRRVRVGNHYVTTASPSRKENSGKLENHDDSSKVIALWHPVKEIMNLNEGSDLEGALKLRCEKQFRLLGELKR